MEVLSVLNKKGGVGKTTVATNLAQGLAIVGQRVLVIDNDGQRNLTSSLGISVKDCPVTLADIMKSPSGPKMESVAAKSIYESFISGLYCVVGSGELDVINPRKTVLSEFLCSKVVQNLKIDFVIIDNAPSMSAKTVSAINASKYFLLPVQLENFSIAGLAEMFEVLTKVYDINPENIFILRNMYRKISHYDNNSRALEIAYPDNIMETIIPHDLVFDKLVCRDKTAFFSQSKCKGTLQFQRLFCELFGFDEQQMFEKFKLALEKYRSEVAKENLKKAKIKNLSLKGVANA